MVKSVFALLVLLNVVLVVLPMGQLLWEAREPDPDDTDSDEWKDNVTDDSNPPESQEHMTSIPLGPPSNDVQDMLESPAPYSDESEPFEPGEPLSGTQHSKRVQQMADDRKPPEPHPDEVDPIGPGKNIPNPAPGEWPPEVWEEDDIDPDAPDWPTPRTDDVPEVEQPTEPYEEDEVPLESVDDLDELPADADIVEDESAVDHNLPDNKGMPH